MSVDAKYLDSLIKRKNDLWNQWEKNTDVIKKLQKERSETLVEIENITQDIYDHMFPESGEQDEDENLR